MSKNEALETSAQSEEKPKQRKSKAKETFSVTLEDGSVIDLDSFDYGETKLTQKEKLFILWYTYPASSSYHDSAKSARKAGYSQKNARMSGYNLRHNPKIAPLIAQFDKDVVKTGIEDAYHRIIQRKIARSEFQGLDFYNIENHIAENGKIHTSVTIKKPEELTEEQKLCIDGLEFVGQHSIPNYKLPNRTAEENKLIELYEKINGEGNKEGYEVETTAEIIKGNLQVKTRVVKANSEITELSELRNKTEERTEED
nr:MAG TPA: Terminase small subunit [Caudoviricetes sp.]